MVTPAGGHKGALKARDLVEVDLQGRGIQRRGIQGCRVPGRRIQKRPTSEWPLHREIYSLRPDIGAICHAHPPWATAFATAGRDLDGNLLTETAALLPRVPVAPRSLPGTEEVPASIRPFIKDHDAVLLANHGAVCVGGSLREAYDMMQTVERLAQVTLLTQLAELAAGHDKLDQGLLAQNGLDWEMLLRLVKGSL
ncbi:aldolase [bacterium DOLJORAL78_65_58]|nr:MAG: aldolase [bacterium DOLJORAL78_65_58]